MVNEEASDYYYCIEDYPIYAIEREKLRLFCLDEFVKENSKYGPMLGDTKMSNSCRIDGMKIGLQGIFARIMWNQLSGGGGAGGDPIFVEKIIPDNAVFAELINAGRTIEQAENVMNSVYNAINQSYKTMISLRQKKLEITKEIVHLDTTDTTNHIYTLTYNEKKLFIKKTYLHKLLSLYHSQTDKNATIDDNIFLRRVFCVLSRYETLSGSSDGYQMAFPDRGFEFLRKKLGVFAECFASPLNCWNDKFCSVAYDTDQFFGSMGNFFQLDTSDGGAFEANPPFVESVINDMVIKIHSLLEKNTNIPLQFIVIVPEWKDCAGIESMKNSYFHKYTILLEKNKHNYKTGMQHRATFTEQKSQVNTLIFFLQNELGSKKWKITKQIMSAFKHAIST